MPMTPDTSQPEGRALLQVVANDTCIGCGACAVAAGGGIRIVRNELDILQADVSSASVMELEAGGRVCPFSDETPSEDAVIAGVVDRTMERDDRLGYHSRIMAAQVTDDRAVEGSSSGGVTTWLLAALLERGLVDGIIHAGPVGGGGFAYMVSTTVDELQSRRKSYYYPTSFDAVLQEVRGDGRRYAFVGVPCFVTAMRHLRNEDPEIREQITILVGLVCGHLKSGAFAKLLAWQAGVPPTELAAVDFRVKVPGRDAGDYDFSAVTAAGERRQIRTGSAMGGNWGHALFQLNACNYCDDVFAETADVVLGDAWLPEFRSDWRGTNVLVARHAEIAAILDQGIREGELRVWPLSPDRAAASQAGNFRHRRDDLAWRLYEDEQAGRWAPRKRVTPRDDLPAARKALVASRRALAADSHLLFRRALEERSLAAFLQPMGERIAAHDALSRRPFVVRVLGRARRLARRVARSAVPGVARP